MMMEYWEKPNLLLEALACLGRFSGDGTWAHLEERLRARKITPSDTFRDALSVMKSLSEHLEPAPETAVLFRNLEGFPKNTIGSSSPAFLLFYGMLEDFDGDFPALLSRMENQTPEQTAYRMAQALDLAENSTDRAMDSGIFLDQVLALSVPGSSKLAILDTFRRSQELTRAIAHPIARVLEVLSANGPAIAGLAGLLSEQIQAAGCESYLHTTSHLIPVPDRKYILRPFLFGMDTSLTSDRPDGSVCVYCGILRHQMLSMLTAQTPIREDVFQAYKLLGDRTRFDILCALRGHSAYGQELSSRFGLSRNTIHHHMSKLISCGLVRCAADGNRIYYTLDPEAVRLLLHRQAELFLGEDA